MTATTTRPTSTPRRAGHASRLWHLLIVVDVAAALVIQLWLILTGGPDPNTGETVASVGIGTRMIQTLSYFTIQSNILVLIAAATLVVDPARDGRFWRILRLDALLGITITGLVFDLVLIRYVHPSGWQLVATIGFHYIAPWATLLGWLIFGPRPASTAAPSPGRSSGRCSGSPTPSSGAPWSAGIPTRSWTSTRSATGRRSATPRFVLVVALVLVAIFKGLDRFRTVGSSPG